MTKLLTILILALTCATLHAQSVIVQGTGAGGVWGSATVTPNVESVLTNLVVTGTLTPDVTGTYTNNGVPYGGYRQWEVNGWMIHNEENEPHTAWNLVPTNDFDGVWWVYNTGYGSPEGGYIALGWPVENCTGTATVVYSYQTNYLPIAAITSVIVRGTATP